MSSDDDDFDFDFDGIFECLECNEKNNYMRGLFRMGLSIDAIKYHMKSFPYSQNHATGFGFIDDFNTYVMGLVDHDFKFLNFNNIRYIKIRIRGFETSMMFKEDDLNSPQYVYRLIFPTDCDNIDYINNKIISVLNRYPHIQLKVFDSHNQEIMGGFPLQGNVDDNEYD